MPAKLPRVILVGGAPCSGKSTVARVVARSLDYDHIAADDLGAAARAVTTPRSHPDLHVMAGYDYREYYIERSPTQLWADATKMHRAAFPALRAVVGARSTWGAPAVVEGWSIRPELVARAGFEASVRAVWLMTDGATLEGRLRRSKSFYEGASDVELLIRRFTDRSLRYNARIEDAAKKGRATVVHANAASPEELCARVLAAVSGSRAR